MFWNKIRAAQLPKLLPSRRCSAQQETQLNHYRCCTCCQSLLVKWIVAWAHKLMDLHHQQISKTSPTITKSLQLLQALLMILKKHALKVATNLIMIILDLLSSKKTWILENKIQVMQTKAKSPRLAKMPKSLWVKNKSKDLMASHASGTHLKRSSTKRQTDTRQRSSANLRHAERSSLRSRTFLSISACTWTTEPSSVTSAANPLCSRAIWKNTN